MVLVERRTTTTTTTTTTAPEEEEEGESRLNRESGRKATKCSEQNAEYPYLS
jgi:hypothetical protein